MNRLCNSGFILLLLLVLGACADEADNFNPRSENGVSGSITRFAVYNGFMYSLNPNGINTYDLSDPDSPQLVHTLPTDYGLETITIYEGTVYIGSTTALYILGIDNPARPEILSRTTREAFFLGEGCDPVVVKDTFAYSTIKIINEQCGNFNDESLLITYNVRNPFNPVATSSYPLSEPNGLGYSDTHLFVCDQDGVFIFSLANPAEPALTEFQIDLPQAVDVIVRGDILLASARTAFHFYDISDISNIRPLSVITR